MSDSIRVAVRVRPFNSREIKHKSKCIIKMKGPQTTIVHPETGKENVFTFDFSYWSHDKSQPYASQQTVYDDLGKAVLEGAWEGYNATLFAYGQTGSGKSYSMVGYGEDKGIIPLACDEIFQRIEKGRDEHHKFKVEASMIEIYNERVRDLFNPKGVNLRVRENPSTGPYVEGLSIISVKNYQEIADLMEKGAAARTVAATNMNDTSSRAHTIFQIILTQTTIRPEDLSATDKVSKINLVDLAGSERANDTGATGDRLKEGSAINKSLSALGNVIAALVKKAEAEAKAAKKGKKGKKVKEVFVPYRDSVLTWLMKESLGGNAKTIMIAAISPADINYEESLSTLKYANRAKQIKNKAVVNEDPNEAIIKALKAEVEQLKKQLAMAGGAKMSLDPEEEKRRQKEIEELKEQLAQSQNIIKQMQMTELEREKLKEEILRNRDKQLADAGVLLVTNTDQPRLTNLHPDPMLSGKLIFVIQVGETIVGRKTKEFSPQIPLATANVKPKNTLIERTEDDVITITPIDGMTYVNGELLTKPQQLHHLDRVIIGSNYVFKFLHEKGLDKMTDEQKQQLPTDEQLDYLFAQQEYADKQGLSIVAGSSEREKELEEKMRALEEKMKKEKQEQLENEKKRKLLEEKQRKMMAMLAEKERQLQKIAKDSPEIEKLKAQLEKQQKEAQEALEREKAEIEKRRIELQEQLKKQEELAKQYEMKKNRETIERSLLEEKLVKIIPLVNEANAITQEIGKQAYFQIKLVNYVYDDGGTQETRTDIAVQVSDLKANTTALWDIEKFRDRFYVIQELYQNFCSSDSEEFVVDKENDPFWDENEYRMIGISLFYLKNLAHKVDMRIWTPIITSKGEIAGELDVTVSPCTESGQLIRNEFVKNPNTLVNDVYYFKVIIDSARGLPYQSCTDVYVSFRIEALDKKLHTTRKDTRRTTCPVFGFETMFSIRPVTKKHLDFLQQSAIKFEVYAKQTSDFIGKPNGRPASSQSHARPQSAVLQIGAKQIAELEHENDSLKAEKNELLQRNKLLEEKLKAMESRLRELPEIQDGNEDSKLNRARAQLQTIAEQLDSEREESKRHQRKLLELEKAYQHKVKEAEEAMSRLRSIDSNFASSIREDSSINEPLELDEQSSVEEKCIIRINERGHISLPPRPKNAQSLSLSVKDGANQSQTCILQ